MNMDLLLFFLDNHVDLLDFGFLFGSTSNESVRKSSQIRREKHAVSPAGFFAP